MADGISVPGLGEVPKKYAIGAVAVAAGLGVIVYMRSRNAATAAASAASTPADTTGTDTSGYYDNSIDPATDVPYAEENAGYGVSDYGGAGAYGSGYDAAGYPIGSQADLSWSAQQTSGIADNQEWVQEALNGTVPGDTATIQAALSSVLGGLTVTTAQKNLFMEAVGILGNPPQGYPPIHTSDTSAQPGTTAGSKPSLRPPGGLSATPYAGSADFGWHPVTGATQYHFQVEGTSVDLHTAGTSVHGVQLPAGNHTWRVAADSNSSYNSSGWATGHVTVKATGKAPVKR